MNPLISQLNPEQQKAVNSLEGPVLVLAGAGSGKTQVVTCRIVRLLESGVPPDEILGLTFTNKAAAEMRERVQRLSNCRVLICTFHSLGSRLLREVIQRIGYGCDFTIYDEEDCSKVLKHCLEEAGLETGKENLQSFRSAISEAKNRLQSPDELQEDLQHKGDPYFLKIYQSYQAKLKSYNAVDFDDLLFLPALIFREFPEVLEIYQKRWSYLLIDEYQDTNQTQYKFIRYLTGGSRNVFAVGDPDQSIYAWRGANIGNILNFEVDFPGAKVIRLEQNYRSRSHILNAANALIRHNSNRYEKKLWSSLGAGEKIKHYVGNNEKDEASFVADRIRHYHETLGVPLRQMAVFYRTHAQSRVFEDAFFYKRIPYVIIGGVSFYQRREIKDILAFLRMVISGSDYVSFARTINLPKRGIGNTTLEKIRQGAAAANRSILSFCEELAEGTLPTGKVRLSVKQKEGLAGYITIIRELKRIVADCSLKLAVQSAIELSGYLSVLQEDQETFDERKANLNALVSKAVEWEEAAPDPSLSFFLEELALKSSLDESDSTKERLNLMTLHNGKGLEFTAVFLVGMEEGLLPHAASMENDAKLEEERRLCYVGVTRAKEYLYLSHVRQRYLWGTPRDQSPSRFLKEIPGEHIEKLRRSSLHSPRRFSVREDEAAEPRFIDEEDQTVPDHLDEEPFNMGDAVLHKNFGTGIVRAAYQGSLGLTYKILFSKDCIERTILAKYAHMQKI